MSLKVNKKSLMFYTDKNTKKKTIIFKQRKNHSIKNGFITLRSNPILINNFRNFSCRKNLQTFQKNNKSKEKCNYHENKFKKRSSNFTNSPKKNKFKFTKLKYNKSLAKKNFKNKFPVKKTLKKNILLIYRYIKKELNSKKKYYLNLLLINNKGEILKKNFKFVLSIFLKNFLKFYYKEFIICINSKKIQNKFLKKAKKTLKKIKEFRFEVFTNEIYDSKIEDIYLKKNDKILKNENLEIYNYKQNDDLKIMIKKFFYDIIKKKQKKQLFEINSFKIISKKISFDNSQNNSQDTFFKVEKNVISKENLSSIKKLPERSFLIKNKNSLSKKKCFPASTFIKVKKFQSKFLISKNRIEKKKSNQFSYLNNNDTFYLFPTIKNDFLNSNKTNFLNSNSNNKIQNSKKENFQNSNKDNFQNSNKNNIKNSNKNKIQKTNSKTLNNNNLQNSNYQTKNNSKNQTFNENIKFEGLPKRRISQQIEICSKLMKYDKFRKQDFFNFINVLEKMDKVKDNNYTELINSLNKKQFMKGKSNHIYDIFKKHEQIDFGNDESKIHIFKNLILQNQKKIDKSFNYL